MHPNIARRLRAARLQWLAVAVLTLALMAPAALAQSFTWPVTSPTVGQTYGCRKCLTSGTSDRYNSGINVHTGADVSGPGAAYTVPVKAAADGWVEKKIAYQDSRGLGNTVILRHANGKYSLYGHLDSITASLGQFVAQGTQLGIMGNSSDIPQDTFGIHVHFEIKDNPTLGNVSDTAGVGYVGYTPGHPDLYAYHDPRLVISGISTSTISPLALVNPPPGSLSVRASPGTTYHGGTASPVIGSIGEGQRVVAKRKATVSGEVWYFVDLPSRNAPLEGSPYLNNGVHGGWISGGVAAQDPSATQIQVVASEYNVRSAAGTGNALVAKVYSAQRFVRAGSTSSGAGCSAVWHPIYLPGNSSLPATTGWICGDGVQVLSSSDSTPPTVAITSPTSSSTYSTSNNPIALAGTASDNQGVSQVTWTNDRGGSGTASGTTSWSIASVALQSGTNIVSVTARDAAGNSATDTLTVTYSPPPASFTLSVSGSGTGTGTVNGSGISCSISSGNATGTCSASFASGSNVSLTASATVGSTFGGWSGSCSGTGSCNMTMNANRTVTASFSAATSGALFAGSFEDPPIDDWGDVAPRLCAAACGWQSPEGCWCDSACVDLGDCCIDACLTCGNCR